MFEGKLPRPGEAHPLGNEQDDGASLRSLSWDDLVARLSAARNLRTELDPAEGSEGSFDAGSARRIAAHHNGKQPVNLDGSSIGKTIEGTAESDVYGAGPDLLSGAVRK